jgi:sugar/nucleoside kinase (ribokinase family)
VASILVIGSVSWDEVVRLDAPLRAGSHNGGHWLGRRIGGGAANTAMALARAGNRAIVVSAVGADAEGGRLVTALAGLGVEVGGIDQGATETTRSLVLLDGSGERTVVNLARARVPLAADLAEQPADCCYARSADPALTPVLAGRLEQGTVIAHVPPLAAGSRPAHVLVGSASDLDGAFLAAPFEAGRHVAGAALRWVVVTAGAEGAVAYGDGIRLPQQAARVEVVDSTGAGDVFAAGLAHAFAAGADMRSALRTAVAWGTASVRYEGTVPPADFIRQVGETYTSTP